jgi:hypothetical protein
MPLSPLPQSQKPWSIAVQNAHQTLYQIYHTRSSYIETGSVEAHRLRQYGNAIIVEAYPVVLLLTESAESESLPLEWIEQVADEFTALLAVIQEHWTSAKDEYVMSGITRDSINLNQIFFRLAANIMIPNHIYSIRSGKRGRPKKFVDPKVLHDAFQKGRRIPTTVLATVLGINRKTLQAQIQETDSNFRYDEITDEELDALVRKYYQENPTGGRAYIIGRLRAAHALRIQRHRVMSSMKRVDPLGQGLRQRIG